MTQIFYCDPCGDERGWIRKMVPVKGRCQVCGDEAMGSQIRRDQLPTPPTLNGQLRFEYTYPKRPQQEEM